MISPKEFNRGTLGPLALTLTLGVSLLGGCSKNLPNDGVNAKTVEFSGLNRVRYIEIFVIGGDPL
jgi:hypothetical protein